MNKRQKLKELRSLTNRTPEQNEEMAALVAEIKNEIRSNGQIVEETNMTNKAKKELRAILHAPKTENRALSVAVNGDAIGKEVVDMFIAEVQNVSPAFEQAKKIKSNQGYASFVRVTADGEALVVPEGTAVPGLDIETGAVNLLAKRLGASFIETYEMLAANPEVEDYAMETLARKEKAAIEKQMFVGGGTTNFTGSITTDTLVPAVTIAEADFAADTNGDFLIDLINTVDSEFHNGAAFYVSPSQRKAISKLRYEDGRRVYDKGEVEGFKVYEIKALEGATSEVVFGNLGEGYAIMEGNAVGSGIRRMEDAALAEKGQYKVIGTLLMDGAVRNSDALVKLVVTE